MSANAHRLLFCFTVIPLVFAMSIALANRANINWAAASYVAFSLWLGNYFAVTGRQATQPWKFWRIHTFARNWKFSLWVFVVIVHLGIGATFYFYHEIASGLGIRLDRRSDPMVHLGAGRILGNSVATTLINQAENGQLPVLVTDDRMLFASLAFYVKPQPIQAQFQSATEFSDQFQITNPIAKYRDAPMIFIAHEEQFDYSQTPPKPLNSTDELPEIIGKFRHSQPLGAITIPLYPNYVLRYRLWKLQGYLGN